MDNINSTLVINSRVIPQDQNFMDFMPNEVLDLILSYLPDSDLPSAAQVDSLFNAIVMPQSDASLTQTQKNMNKKNKEERPLALLNNQIKKIFAGFSKGEDNIKTFDLDGASDIFKQLAEAFPEQAEALIQDIKDNGVGEEMDQSLIDSVIDALTLLLAEQLLETNPEQAKKLLMIGFQDRVYDNAAKKLIVQHIVLEKAKKNPLDATNYLARKDFPDARNFIKKLAKTHPENAKDLVHSLPSGDLKDYMTQVLNYVPEKRMDTPFDQVKEVAKRDVRQAIRTLQEMNLSKVQLAQAYLDLYKS